LAYCFRSTNGGTGYTESWCASRHEGTISTCVFSLKKKKKKKKKKEEKNNKLLTRDWITLFEARPEKSWI
jgi:hypothetical protein